LSPSGDHVRVAGFMTAAVGPKLLEEALVEAVFGTIGYSLADHFAGEVEVGEDLRQGKGAPVGGELLVDVLDAGFVGDREAGAAAAMRLISKKRSSCQRVRWVRWSLTDQPSRSGRAICSSLRPAIASSTRSRTASISRRSWSRVVPILMIVAPMLALKAK